MATEPTRKEVQDVLKFDPASEHTPWSIQHGAQILDATGDIVCETQGDNHEQAMARAQIIKRAANCHDELVDACEAADLALNECAKHLLGTGPIPEPEALALTITELKAALAKAKK